MSYTQGNRVLMRTNAAKGSCTGKKRLDKPLFFLQCNNSKDQLALKLPKRFLFSLTNTKLTPAVKVYA